jgi:predicted nucleic acid-binding protein
MAGKSAVEEQIVDDVQIVPAKIRTNSKEEARKIVAAFSWAESVEQDEKYVAELAAEFVNATKVGDEETSSTKEESEETGEAGENCENPDDVKGWIDPSKKKLEKKASRGGTNGKPKPFHRTYQKKEEFQPRYEKREFHERKFNSSPAGKPFIKYVTSPFSLSGWKGKVEMQFPPLEVKMWTDHFDNQSARPMEWRAIPIHPANFIDKNLYAEHAIYEMLYKKIDRNRRDRPQDVNCYARMGVAFVLVKKTEEELTNDKYPQIPNKVLVFLCKSSHHIEYDKEKGKQIVRSLYYPQLCQPMSIESAVKYMQKPTNTLPEDFLQYSRDLYNEHLNLTITAGLIDEKYTEPKFEEYKELAENGTKELNAALEQLRAERQ